jgi:TonB family protein
VCFALWYAGTIASVLPTLKNGVVRPALLVANLDELFPSENNMPSLKDGDTNAPADLIAASLAADSLGQKPVAMEVPITVNGARPLEGKDKREPFSESTKTVLVFGNGAVIRLGFAAAPGQLLFVTNERTKKEVVCQVVRSKGSKSSSGYVEIEFTEPTAGFWGLRFPAERAALRSGISPSDSESDADEFLRSAMDASAPLTRKTDTPSSDSGIGSQDERFKPERKSEERASISNKSNSVAEGPANTSKSQAIRLQERLSTLLSAQRPITPEEKPSSALEVELKTLSDTTVKPIEQTEAKLAGKTLSFFASQPVKTLPSSGTAASDAKPGLPADEFKVPAWLQPLTQDTSASTGSEKSAAKKPMASLAEGPKLAVSEEKPQPQSKVKAPRITPVVGSGLLGQSTAPLASQHSRTGLVVTVAAGLLVAAAGATWYLKQPTGPALTNRSIRSTQVPAAPALSPAGDQSAVVATPATDTGTTSSSQQELAAGPADTTVRVVATPLPPPSKPVRNFVPENTSASSSARSSQQPAVITERIGKSSSMPNAESPTASASKDSVEPEPKKVSLDNPPLAKPNVKRRNQSAGVTAPALSEANTPTVAPDTSLGAGPVNSAGSQPAAPASPAPIGGDVKPARLLSSVAPVYPAIAKSQRVAGDVRVDALIDANGQVSSMKVISGPPLLHQAAMDALRQWKYQPATLNGTAVPMHLTVTIQFHAQ